MTRISSIFSLIDRTRVNSTCLSYREICFFKYDWWCIICIVYLVIVNYYLLIRYSLYFQKNTELTWDKGYIFDLGQKLPSDTTTDKWPHSFLVDQGITCSHHSFLKLGGRTYVIVEKIISHVNINYSNWFFLFIKKTQWLLDSLWMLRSKSKYDNFFETEWK